MGLCLLRRDAKHDARCGLASSICGYSRIAVGRLEWFQTLGRLLCYVDFSLCANRNRIPNDPVASKDRRRLFVEGILQKLEARASLRVECAKFAINDARTFDLLKC